MDGEVVSLTTYGESAFVVFLLKKISLLNYLLHIYASAHRLVLVSTWGGEASVGQWTTAQP